MFETGFYQDDLKIHYQQRDEDYIINKSDKNAKAPITLRNYCTIIYIFNGEVPITVVNKTIIARSNTAIILKSNTPFRILRGKKSEQEIIMCSFFPQVFSKVDGDKNFLRVFFENGSIFFTESDQGNDNNLIPFFSLLKTMIFEHYGRVHILGILTSIISQLCLIYDKNHTADIQATDSIPVKIIDYINRHYYEKITMKALQDEFFVSATTINTIVKNTTGLTFKNYLNELRMNDAHKMIDDGIIPMRIYNLIGFQDYSSFFRAYKKHFGIAPTYQNKNSNKQTHWPLS